MDDDIKLTIPNPPEPSPVEAVERAVQGIEAEDEGNTILTAHRLPPRPSSLVPEQPPPRWGHEHRHLPVDFPVVSAQT